LRPVHARDLDHGGASRAGRVNNQAEGHAGARNQDVSRRIRGKNLHNFKDGPVTVAQRQEEIDARLEVTRRARQTEGRGAAGHCTAHEKAGCVVSSAPGNGSVSLDANTA
jgi:hypothetical protein